MARSRRTSPAEDLMDLVALLPWWAGVGLALLTYLLLHAVAGQTTQISMQPGQVADGVMRVMFVTLARYGQYLVPFLCLVSAGVSAVRSARRARLVTNVAESASADALHGMSWREFESLVGEGFRLQGYQVVETGGGGADGGVDLVLGKGSEKFLVQCKQWKAFKVGVDVVRELYGVMAARGAAGGFVVTSGRFTNDAVEFASGRNVKLVDGSKLHALIRQARAAKNMETDRRAATVAPVVGPAMPAPTATDASSTASPDCPRCARPMLRRTAKRGASAGAAFWGCTGYPACKGTRAIE